MILECKKSGSRVVVNGVKNDDDTSPKKSCYVQANAAEQGTENLCRLFVKEVFETTFYICLPYIQTKLLTNKTIYEQS